ncbi:TIGR03086 family protein [Actinomadura barringtoniae]|uniref:TIGR03086 family protein n=1 Tax=Actinomadura barringtoniae TaxID=1427535 RepID=A0A939PFX6_9ACTN|nr:TIGR03086 family metal-binding protein [Actinomadura barringtoniae]MBO2449009.1 TIGR03086 family protein [Actinomadura barringtoniae]
MTENTTTDWTVLAEAHEALRTAVRGLGAEDLTKPTPCSEWNVAQVIQHAVGDQIAYAAFITGGPGPEDDPFSPSGSLAESPEAMVERATAASAAAWATVAPDAQEVAVPMPPNKMTAEIGAGACAVDALVHAWDIALATGRPSPITPELARTLLPVAHAIVIEPLRQYGAFAQPIEDAPGDTDVAALLHFLGRNPSWSA